MFDINVIIKIMNLNSIKNNGQKGYTLVEIMVVIAIIGILSSVTFVAFSSAREKSRMSTAKMFEANHVGVLRNYLVAEWKFDDANNRFLDSSGNGHDGSCTGDICPVVAITEGFNGKDAMRFDGINDRIYIGIGTDYFPLNSFTLCSWIKTPGLGAGMSWGGIVGMTYGLSFSLNSQSFLSSRMHNGSTMTWVSYNKNISDDKFHHVCLNYNGINRKMYLDGSLVYEDNMSWTGTTPWPTASAQIGVETNNPGVAAFNGLIDDVRIYSSYLTASEIQRLYAEESAQRKLAEVN